jgi:WD40 repeat protein
MTECPSSEQLRQWLADGQSGPEAEAVEAHVEACADCQQAVEDLLGNAGGRTAREPDGREEVSGDFLRRLERDPPSFAGPFLAPNGRAAPASCTPTGEAAAEERPPTVAGYEILEELGRGGMGVVYKARHLRLDRVVALKVVLAGAHAGPERLARFRTEAATAARLQHPHIVQIYEVGEQDGRPFLALEYVDGGSLAEKLAGTPQPPRAAAELVETLARAVQAAHDRGVVHRDLKPANVLLTADGTPKLTDFGLAKQLDVDAGQTPSGAVLGTPSYMAPEQAQGQNRAIGPPADIYALGAVLYECLTGRPPFQAATSLDTVLQVLRDEPVPPGRLVPQVPRDLETVCLKCLRKEPAGRYSSAEALTEDLERWRAGRPVRARPVRAWGRLLYWVKRRPGAAALLAVSILAGLALLVLTLSLLWNAQTQAAYRQAEDARAEEQRQRALARRYLYAAHLNLAQRAWEEGRAQRVRELLEGQMPARTGGVDLRGFEWHYLWRFGHAEHFTVKAAVLSTTSVAFSPDGRRLAGAAWSSGLAVKVWDVATGQEVMTLQGHPDPVASVAFSPDGRRLASAGQGGTVKVWDLEAGQEVLTFNARSGPMYGLAYSPDGRCLAIAGHKMAKVWDAGTGRETLGFKGHTSPVTAVAFSPDGRHLASADASGTVKVWDAATGRETVPIKGHTAWVNSVTFSPDGRRLATAGNDGTARVWDAATGQEVHTLNLAGVAAYTVAFTADGRHLATAGFLLDRRHASADRLHGTLVTVWDAATGQHVGTVRGHPHGVRSLVFSPGGRWLACASPYHTVTVWDREVPQEPLRLQGHTAVVQDVTFSPDSRRLASASWDKTVKVWDAQSGQEVRDLKGHTLEVSSVAFSPDGRRLASSSHDRTVKVWDAATGREVLTLPRQRGPARGVAFSPDGRSIAGAGSDAVRVWDAATGRETQILRAPGMFFEAVAYSPDGRRLAVAAQKAVQVWDLQTGQVVFSHERPPYPVPRVVYSPDGRWIASPTNDNAVRVWDADTGQEALTLKGHALNVLGVAFSPDSRRLASGSGDGAVKIWDLVTGEEVLTLRTSSGNSGCYGLSFSPDGRRLASAGDDGTVKIWDATPGSKDTTAADGR